jgi:histidinol-phosphate aminotransferase
MEIRACLKDLIPYTPGVLKEGAIKLASNENPLGVSPKAQQKITECAGNASLYPDGGCVALRKALASKLSLTPENIIVGNGSDEVLIFVAGTLIEPGDNAITSESTFSEYAYATHLYGGIMKYAPMKNGCFQLDEILNRIDINTKIIFLCNPNNPTGTYFNNDTFVKFMNKVPSGVCVVMDEAYIEYATNKDFPPSIELIEKFKNLIVLRTYSKLYGLAGMRVGYGIANNEFIYNLNKARSPFNVNILAQEAATAALSDNDFVNRSLTMNEAGKKYLYNCFDSMGLKYYKTEANFIFVYINQDCKVAFEKLMELGITIRPLKSFGFNDAIRITIGTQEQNEFFINCLKNILV